MFANRAPAESAAADLNRFRRDVVEGSISSEAEGLAGVAGFKIL